MYVRACAAAEAEAAEAVEEARVLMPRLRAPCLLSHLRCEVAWPLDSFDGRSAWSSKHHMGGRAGRRAGKAAEQRVERRKKRSKKNCVCVVERERGRARGRGRRAARLHKD